MTPEEESARLRCAQARRIVVKIGTQTISRPTAGATSPALPAAADASAASETLPADSRAAASAASPADSRAAASAASPGTSPSDTATEDAETGSNHQGVDREYLEGLAEEIRQLRAEGREVLIVSSGAIGMGSRALGLSQKTQSIPLKQACASIGQPLLMQAYRDAFQKKGIITAQILLTREQFNHRESFNNLRNAMEKLIRLGVVPIINENDSISTEEIGHAFGDNDQLSAYVASKIDAQLLILLSDVDGLYTANPRLQSDARLISYVAELEQSHLDSARGKGSSFSTGGMATKLKAVQIARDAGCQVVLAHGRRPGIIQSICAGHASGTLFEAREAMKSRLRWIKHAEAAGELEVDSGAMAAILEHRSLLPKGIVRVRGVFPRGSVLLVNEKVKLVSAFDSSELQRILGKHSSTIREILGPGSADVIARPEDMVILE